MHATVGAINRIIDRVTSPAMLTKTVFVIFTKFKFTSFRSNFQQYQFFGYRKPKIII